MLHNKKIKSHRILANLESTYYFCWKMRVYYCQFHKNYFLISFSVYYVAHECTIISGRRFIFHQICFVRELKKNEKLKKRVKVNKRIMFSEDKNYLP